MARQRPHARHPRGRGGRGAPAGRQAVGDRVASGCGARRSGVAGSPRQARGRPPPPSGRARRGRGDRYRLPVGAFCAVGGVLARAGVCSFDDRAEPASGAGRRGGAGHAGRAQPDRPRRPQPDRRGRRLVPWRCDRPHGDGSQRGDRSPTPADASSDVGISSGFDFGGAAFGCRAGHPVCWFTSRLQTLADSAVAWTWATIAAATSAGWVSGSQWLPSSSTKRYGPVTYLAVASAP